MRASIKDMTTGKPLPLIISFALPLMVGNIFQQLYTVVDTMVVGKALGVDALAALGATDWLYWMMLGMIQGVTQGFGILMAREFGAKQYESLRAVVGSSTSLSAVSSVLFLILGQAVAKPILVLLNTPAEIMGGSLLYLRIMFLGIPVVMAYNLLATILRSLGDGQTPLYAMIVAALSNIILDLLFVLVFHWGIAGAAIATLIAQGISSVYCLIKIRKIEFMTLKKAHFSLNPAMAGRLLSLGSPMAAQNAIIAVGGMIITAVVNGLVVHRRIAQIILGQVENQKALFFQTVVQVKDLILESGKGINPGQVCYISFHNFSGSPLEDCHAENRIIGAILSDLFRC